MGILRDGMKWKFVWLLPVCMVISATRAESEPHRFVTPEDPEFLVGDQLRLNCSLKGKLNGFNSSDLVFKLRFYGNSSDVNIPSTFVHQMGKRTAQLRYVELKQEHHLAKVFCGLRILKDDEYAIITVGHAPRQPRISHWRLCNWETFVFQWEVPECTNGFKTKYTACYKNINETDYNPAQCKTEIYSDCPPQSLTDPCTNPDPCINPDQHFRHSISDALTKFRPHKGTVILKVTASNKLRKSWIETEPLLVIGRVQPGSVTEVKVFETERTNVVSFLAPSHHETCFQINVKCGIKTMTYFTHSTSRRVELPVLHKLSDLPYNSECSLAIRALPLNGPCSSETKEGSHYWSTWTNGTTFKSLQNVPIAAPEVCSKCFEIRSVRQKCGYRVVFIHFKQLSNKNARGDVIGYRVRSSNNDTWYFSEPSLEITDDNECKEECPFGARNNWALTNTPLDRNCSETIESTINNVPSRSFYGKILLLIDREFNLTLDARTKLGYNEELRWNSILIPSQIEVPPGPSNFTVVARGSRARLSWNPSTTTGLTPEHYSLIWCQGSMNDMTCTNQAKWVKLSEPNKSYDLHLNESVRKFLFGISMTSSDGRSSGIQWASCVYDSREVSQPPQLFTHSITTSEISLKIHKPPCSFKTGYVYGYIVYCWFCRDLNCTEESRIFLSSHFVDENSPTLTLSDLESSTSVLFLAESLTEAGSSFKNSSLIVRTAKGRELTGAERNTIIIGSIIGGLLVIIGLITIIKFNKRLIERVHDWWTVAPKVENAQSLNTKYGTIPNDYYRIEGYPMMKSLEGNENNLNEEPSCSLPEKLTQANIADNLEADEQTNMLPKIKSYKLESSPTSDENCSDKNGDTDRNFISISGSISVDSDGVKRGPSSVSRQTSNTICADYSTVGILPESTSSGGSTTDNNSSGMSSSSGKLPIDSIKQHSDNSCFQDPRVSRNDCGVPLKYSTQCGSGTVSGLIQPSDGGYNCVQVRSGPVRHGYGQSLGTRDDADIFTEVPMHVGEFYNNDDILICDSLHPKEVNSSGYLCENISVDQGLSKLDVVPDPRILQTQTSFISVDSSDISDASSLSGVTKCEADTVLPSLSMSVDYKSELLPGMTEPTSSYEIHTTRPLNSSINTPGDRTYALKNGNSCLPIIAGSNEVETSSSDISDDHCKGPCQSLLPRINDDGDLPWGVSTSLVPQNAPLCVPHGVPSCDPQSVPSYDPQRLTSCIPKIDPSSYASQSVPSVTPQSVLNQIRQTIPNIAPNKSTMDSKDDLSILPKIRSNVTSVENNGDYNFLENSHCANVPGFEPSLRCQAYDPYHGACDVLHGSRSVSERDSCGLRTDIIPSSTRIVGDDGYSPVVDVNIGNRMNSEQAEPDSQDGYY